MSLWSVILQGSRTTAYYYNLLYVHVVTRRETMVHPYRNTRKEKHEDIKKKTFVHIRAYKYTPTWKSPAHIHANTVTHILRISGVPLGHALGRNHTHNTVVVFLPPGAVIGSGVADSLGRLRMSSLNHDGKGHLLLSICFQVFAQNTEMEMHKTTLIFTI